MDRRHVEEEEEADEEEEHREQANPHQDDLPLPLVLAAEGDEGQQGVGEQEARDEAEEVGVVVHPGQETGQEEHGRHAHQLEDGHLGVLEHRPLVDHLHHAARQQAEVRARRPDLERERKRSTAEVVFLAARQLTSAR